MTVYILMVNKSGLDPDSYEHESSTFPKGVFESREAVEEHILHDKDYAWEFILGSTEDGKLPRWQGVCHDQQDFTFASAFAWIEEWVVQS